MLYLSPLRYPGGKRKLANFIKLIFHTNTLVGSEYVEPYAGGASVALSLLYEEYVKQIFINDIDLSIFAFWHSVLNDTENLCRLIRDTPISVDEWERQRRIQFDKGESLLKIGFSTFFLNRTNRSGIISGGIIGGKEQTGRWLIDARYNKQQLIERVQKVARYKSRIQLFNLDAITFLDVSQTLLTTNALFYFDPPYYVKGKQKLYTNFYKPYDHAVVASAVSKIKSHHWMVSYDDTIQIRELYQDFQSIHYGLKYSAQEHYDGAEVIFFSENLKVPIVSDPVRVNSKTFQKSLFTL